MSWISLIQVISSLTLPQRSKSNWTSLYSCRSEVWILTAMATNREPCFTNQDYSVDDPVQHTAEGQHMKTPPLSAEHQDTWGSCSPSAVRKLNTCESNVKFSYWCFQMGSVEEKLSCDLHPSACVLACRFPLPSWTPTLMTGTGLDTVWLYDRHGTRHCVTLWLARD